LLTFTSADSLPMMGHQGMQVGGQDLHLGCSRSQAGELKNDCHHRHLRGYTGDGFAWRSLEVECKQPPKGPCSVWWVVSWIRCRFSFGTEEDDGCSRANFDEPEAHDAVFASDFLCIAN
jgi:hypothetical protein